MSNTNHNESGLQTRFYVVRAFLEFMKMPGTPPVPPELLSDARDRGLYTHLLKGMIRNERLLNTEIKRITKPERRLSRVVRTIIKLGLFELMFLDRVPAHATIHQAVSLAGRFRIQTMKSLINAVLRNFQRQLEQGYNYRTVYPLGVRESFPDWMIHRWNKVYGPEITQKLCETSNHFGGLCVRPLPPWDIHQLQNHLQQEHIECVIHPLVEDMLIVDQGAGLLDTPAFRQGKCYLQDASNWIFLKMSRPLFHGAVLDVCAAPGGKALEISRNSRISALIVNDSSGTRLKRLRANYTRSGTEMPGIIQSDGSKLPFNPRQFDTVLLDVPCSSSGTVKKNPDIKWRKSESELLRHLPLQQCLLEESARVLKKTGTLVYATCSLEPEENEEQILLFLNKHPEYQLCSFRVLVTVPESWQAFITPLGWLKILPDDTLTGFFAALLRFRE